MRRLRLMASLTTPLEPAWVLGGPIDANHVGTEIPQDHRGMRARPDAGQLDNSQSGQWSRHDLPTFRLL